jgi:hypothetical protein
MDRTNVENNSSKAKRQIVDSSSTNGAKSNVADAPAKLSAEQLEVRKSFSPAAPLERVAARVVAATKPKMNKKEVKQEKEALSTWEDEGGTAATGPAKRSD